MTYHGVSKSTSKEAKGRAGEAFHNARLRLRLRKLERLCVRLKSSTSISKMSTLCAHDESVHHKVRFKQCFDLDLPSVMILPPEHDAAWQKADKQQCRPSLPPWAGMLTVAHSA